MDSPEQLIDEYRVKQTILAARNHRLKTDFGINRSEVSAQLERDRLLGYCHENALTAAEFLNDAGYDPLIIWGAHTEEGGYHPDSRLDAEQNGLIHFWVELEDEHQNPLVAEMATETRLGGAKVFGDPLVTRGRPDNYTVPDGCRIRFDPSIHSKDLRNGEGYEKLAESGLVVEG